jgi:hypothetical protein
VPGICSKRAAVLLRSSIAANYDGNAATARPHGAAIASDTPSRFTDLAASDEDASATDFDHDASFDSDSNTFAYSNRCSAQRCGGGQ